MTTRTAHAVVVPLNYNNKNRRLRMILSNKNNNKKKGGSSFSLLFINIFLFCHLWSMTTALTSRVPQRPARISSSSSSSSRGFAFAVPSLTTKTSSTSTTTIRTSGGKSIQHPMLVVVTRQERTTLYANPTPPKNICILGGGFGGLNAALTLASLPFAPQEEKLSITLIDSKDRFVFLPLLYELCVGDADLNEVAPTYRSLLQNTDIEFQQGTVQGIDIEKNVVYLTDSSTSAVSYDSLVVATGSHVNLEFIPGASNRAIPFYTIQDCYELRKILTLLDSIPCTEFQRELNVVIVGGGYSGVELALNLMERLKPIGKGVKITLVHRGNQILEYATEYNQKTAMDRLQSMGVHVMTRTSVMEVMDPDDDGGNDDHSSKDRLLLQRGEGTIWPEDWKSRSRIAVLEKDSKIQHVLDADILLWTAGAMSTNVQKGILNSKLPRDSSGRIVVTKYLNAKDCENVFALGDCSRVMNERNPYPATAAVAMQQAPFVAWNVYSYIMKTRMEKGTASSVTGRLQDQIKPMPFSLVNLGEMMTLGGQDATISSMGVVQLSGVAASVMRRLIYAVRMPTPQQGLVAAMLSSAKRLESLLKQVQVGQ